MAKAKSGGMKKAAPATGSASKPKFGSPAWRAKYGMGSKKKK